MRQAVFWDTISSIFLSHDHKEKAFVRKLAERLNAHGSRTWVDEAEIRVGDSLIMKIESAIKDFAYLGVILSPSSVKAQWVDNNQITKGTIYVSRYTN